jgi:MarR family 2-MHQ and catechol resistance regulon transcriptional repressor
MSTYRKGIAPSRTQRKPIVRLPDEMLTLHEEQFPGTFERHTTIAMFALRALAQRVNDCTNDTLAPIGLNAAKYNYLVVLYMTPKGMLTLNEISDLIHTSNATVTSMVKTLEADGLLRRAAHPTDGRSVVVRLTAKGRKLIEAAIPLHHRNIDDAMTELTMRERGQLGALLLKLAAGFERLS